MAMEGYIKVFRSMLKWEWYTKPVTRSLFQHCLLKANYQESRWKGIIIPAGSFITSEQTLCQELTFSRREIRTALTHLKSTNDITIKATSKYTMINVVNWAKYQSNEIDIDQPNAQPLGQQEAKYRPSTDQVEAIVKELKNLKKERIKEEVLKDVVANAPTLFGDVPIAISRKRKPKAFVPPTLEEIKAYALERQSPVDPKAFFDFFDVSKWIDSKGEPVLNWKQKFITWDTKQKEKEKTQNEKGKRPTVLTKSYGERF